MTARSDSGSRPEQAHGLTHAAAGGVDDNAVALPVDGTHAS